MYAPNDNAASSRSVLMRFLVRSWEYRHPRLWVGVRVACGIFNVALASFCSLPAPGWGRWRCWAFRWRARR